MVFYEAEGDADQDRYIQLGVLYGSKGKQCSDQDYPSIFARLEDPEIWSFVFNKTYPDQKGWTFISILL